MTIILPILKTQPLQNYGKQMTLPTENNAIDTARYLIDSIQEKLDQLYAIAPSLKGNEIIQEPLYCSQADFIQAAAKLASPALRIATIGTTSAGKSTLVNGLIGRKIAPMDAAELSAGILHLVHSPQSRLQIKKPNKGSWQGIDQSNLDDKSIYDHVRENVFKVYHKDKETQTISVPEVRIEGPLLPAAWTDLLKLPAGVGIEIYDLPGLNSIADKDNLKVIQDHLKQCFSLVVMNYSHTDSSNRSELLKQVKNVVEALGGKTDAMLFVLNGVNLRNETDDPLEQRLSDFALAIQTELGLLETPKIMPINAQALFYAQCAWGYSDPTKEQPTTDAVLQAELLKKFNRDCAKFTKQHQQKDDKVKIWLRAIEDAIEENSSYLPAELISTENLRQWFKWSWEHSGGLALWNELRQRVNERLAEIVIAPALIQPLASLDVLLTTLDQYSETQRLSDKDAVEKKKQELQQEFKDLQSFLEQKSQEFEAEIQDTVQLISAAMASSNEKEIDAAVKKLFGVEATDTEPKAAEILRTIVRDIKNDLSDNLITSVHKYYSDGLGTDDLKEQLNKTLSPEQRDAIVKAADTYRARGMAGDDAPKNGINLKIRKGDEDGEKSIKSIKNAAHNLFKEMREGLTARASYILQTKDQAIQQALSALLERGIADIEQRIKDELPESAEALLAIYRQQLAQVEFSPLSDNIFALKTIETENLSTREKTGTDRIVHRDGSCFASERIEVKDRIEDVEYTTLTLPNIEEMAGMWVNGINNAEASLWLAVGAWFSQSARAQNQLFQASLKQSQAHLLGLLNQRLVQSDDEYKFKIAELESLDALCHNIKVDKNELMDSGNT